MLGLNATGWAGGVVAPVAPGSWVKVAAFRCGETDRLGRELGFPVAVAAAVDDPAAHARRMSERWHGALRPRRDWYLPFDSWEVRPREVAYKQFGFDPRWMGGRFLPKGTFLDDGCVSVDLPRCANRRTFALALEAMMGDMRFDRVAARPSHVRYRSRTGRTLEVGARYGTSPTSWDRPELVDDLYAFRPRDLVGLVGRTSQALDYLEALANGVRRA